MRYNLVHFTSGEYATPLVASQLFDQAEIQALDKTGFAPDKVDVWIVEPMREYLSKKARRVLKSLSERCPHVNISMFGGINRLNNFPAMLLMIWKRLLLNPNIPVIYHCRGEYAGIWGKKMKKYFPSDKLVLDMRGFWPAEMLYERGILVPEEAQGKDHADYVRVRNILKNVILSADGVTAVSYELKNLLRKEFNLTAAISIVPCCVKMITPDTERDRLRKEWGIRPDEIAIVYSGTAAAYQHLEDLTLPFLKQLMDRNDKVRLLLFTPDLDAVKAMAVKQGVNPDRTIIKKLSQQEVATALTAADAGVLIRKPTLVNKVANPVKIAEYLSSGLSLIIQDGIGGLSDDVLSTPSVCRVNVAGVNGDMQKDVDIVCNWLEKGYFRNRENARDLARKEYLWTSAVKTHRAMYRELLDRPL